MRQRLRPILPDLVFAAVLFLMPLIFFLPQTLGGRTMLPVDNLFQWEPYASIADEHGVGTPHNHLISDLILENAAWKEFFRESVSQGDLPLWQTNIATGTPFLAAGQSQSLYPLSLLFVILPIWLAFGWFTVITLWIAGVNLYVLARVLGLRRIPALIAALTYQLSGFMLISGVFPMIISVAAWLPLILAMVELTLRQGSALGGKPATIPWVALGAVGIGLAGLAGHVEALYFVLLVTAYYAAFRVIAAAIATRKEADLWGRIGRRVGWLIVLVGLGLALAAVQIIPSYELASNSFRQGAASYDEVIGWAFPARRALAFIMPNFFGNPSHHSYFDLFLWQVRPITANTMDQPITHTEWGIKNYVEGAAYLGILPMALAVIAFAHWIAGRTTKPPEAGERKVLPLRNIGMEGAGRPYRLLFAVLSIFSLSFVFGTPTYALLYYGLPFINQSHSPFRWVWPLTLAISVLAGFGAELLQELHQPAAGTLLNVRVSQIHRRIISVVAWVLIAAAVLTILFVIAVRLTLIPNLATYNQIFEALANAPNAFPDVHAFFSYEAINALIFAIIAILSAVALLLVVRDVRLQRFGWRPIWKPLAIGVVILDLFIASWGFFPAADPDLLDVTPASIAQLQAMTIQGRSSDQPPLDYSPYLWRYAIYEEPGADTLNSNIGWLYGLQEISGYDSLIPAQYAEFMEAIQPQTDLPYNRIAPLYSNNHEVFNSPLIDLLNVRYLITETELPNANPAKWNLAYQDDAVMIYENLGKMDRAFTLPDYSAAAYAEGGFGEAARQFDPRVNVMIPLSEQEMDSAAEAYPAVEGIARPATITVYENNEVWIDVQTIEPSWLVLSDAYFPGWRAWIRPFGEETEQETELYLVDGNFRGVYIEAAGNWTIRMKYSPDSVRFGAFASFMAGMLIVFMAGVYGWRYIYREGAAGGSDVQRVAKNSFAPIVLNLFNRGIQFAFAIIMARILLPEGVGKYYFAVAIWGWFDILSNFGLNTLLTREVARDPEHANRYLANTGLLRIGLAAIGVPIFAAVIAIQQMVLPALTGAAPLTQDTVIALWILYGGLFLSTQSYGLTALFYAYQKAEIPAAIGTISAMLSAVLGVMALMLGWGIIGLAAVSVIVNGVTLIILYSLTSRLFFRPRFEYDAAIQRVARNESFPLMLNHLLATLFFRVDVILLRPLMGDTTVGWYSVAYKWVDALNIIPSFFTQALFPVMSRQASEDRPALLRSYILSIKLLTLFSLPVMVSVMLMAHFLTRLFGGDEFLPHGAIALQLFVISIPIGWINSVTNYVVIAINKQRALTWTFIAGLTFNVIANLIFIPRVEFGYPAAAVITSLSELLLLVLFYLVLRRDLGRVYWLRTMWKFGAALALMGAVAYVLYSVNVVLAVGASLAVYVIAIALLRPFTDEEIARIAPLLPGRLRARFTRVETVIGEV